MLKFTVKGQSLIRLDCNKLIQYAQDYPEAVFTFDDDWLGLTRTVQWSMGEAAYDTPVADDGKVIVPWEVLRDKGVLNVNAVGVADNKIITTNTVSINVMGCGVVGGMVSGKPSGTFYSELDGRVSKIELDRETTFAVQELVTEIIRQAGGLRIRTTEDEDNPDNAALVDINPETGIRILNNLPKDSDWYIKIGQGNEKGDVDYGIMYRSDNGEFWVMHNGQAFICLIPNSNGTLNFIRGNETLKIISKDGMLSFASDDAGIDYHKATWTERLKQLDVFTDKGINMEGKNNSYWWVNEEKKAVYGNTLNKLEFRTDGVAKFSNKVNAPDYQISGNSVKDQLNTISNLAEDTSMRVKWVGQDFEIDDENLGYKIIAGDGEYSSYVQVNLSLKPNTIYYIKSNGEDYNYLTTLNIKSLQKHRGVDIFQLRLILRNGNDVNTDEIVAPATIILPTGVIWENYAVPTIKSGTMYVLTITQGVATLEKYGELSKNTMYPNGIYAAAPDFYYKLPGVFEIDGYDPDDPGSEYLSMEHIYGYDGALLAGATHNSKTQDTHAAVFLVPDLRYSFSVDWSKIPLVCLFSIVCDNLTDDTYVQILNVGLTNDSNNKPYQIWASNVSPPGCKWETAAPTEEGTYNFTIFHRVISWERVGK